MPASIDDRLALLDLTIAYCWALDTKDWGGLDDVFTPDATADLGADAVGLDGIKARVSGVLTPLDSSQHIVSNHQVAVDGDTATSKCYFHAQHTRRDAADGRNYVVAGAYHDRMIRTEAGWRIVRRDLSIWWTDGNPGVVRGDRPA